MKTGLLFGSFNPIHKGHIAIAKAMLKKAKLDEVWFVVSPHNPHKAKRGLLPEKLRLELVKLAVENLPALKACDTEFKLPKPSYTYRTLRAFRKTFPKKEFLLIIGSDNLENFETWKNYKEILRHHQLLVYPRKGSPVGKKFSDHIEVVSAPLLSISATAIRAALRKGESAARSLPPGVSKFVKKIKESL
jgi:nicotinate-nucleotide adenylyltransferase